MKEFKMYLVGLFFMNIKEQMLRLYRKFGIIFLSLSQIDTSSYLWNFLKTTYCGSMKQIEERAWHQAAIRISIEHSGVAEEWIYAVDIKKHVLTCWLLLQKCGDLNAKTQKNPAEMSDWDLSVSLRSWLRIWYGKKLHLKNKLKIYLKKHELAQTYLKFSIYLMM